MQYKSLICHAKKTPQIKNKQAKNPTIHTIFLRKKIIKQMKPGMFSMTCTEKDFNAFSGNIPKPNQHC